MLYTDHYQIHQIRCENVKTIDEYTVLFNKKKQNKTDKCLHLCLYLKKTAAASFNWFGCIVFSDFFAGGEGLLFFSRK